MAACLGRMDSLGGTDCVCLGLIPLPALPPCHSLTHHFQVTETKRLHRLECSEATPRTCLVWLSSLAERRKALLNLVFAVTCPGLTLASLWLILYPLSSVQPFPPPVHSLPFLKLSLTFSGSFSWSCGGEIPLPVPGARFGKTLYTAQPGRVT